MRTLLVLAALTTATTVLASPFSVNGIYGNAATCALYALGGNGAVSEPDNYPDVALTLDEARAPDYLLISESDVAYYEANCRAQSVDGDSVTLECSSEGNVFSLEATIQEHPAEGTLTFNDEYGDVTLSRCPEPATM